MSHQFFRIEILRVSVPLNYIMFAGLLLIGGIDLMLLNSAEDPFRFLLLVSLVAVITLLLLLAQRMSAKCKAIKNYYTKMAKLS